MTITASAQIVLAFCILASLTLIMIDVWDKSLRYYRLEKWRREARFFKKLTGFDPYGGQVQYLLEPIPIPTPLRAWEGRRQGRTTAVVVRAIFEAIHKDQEVTILVETEMEAFRVYALVLDLLQKVKCYLSLTSFPRKLIKFEGGGSITVVSPNTRLASHRRPFTPVLVDVFE